MCREHYNEIPDPEIMRRLREAAREDREREEMRRLLAESSSEGETKGSRTDETAGPDDVVCDI